MKGLSQLHWGGPKAECKEASQGSGCQGCTGRSHFHGGTRAAVTKAWKENCRGWEGRARAQSLRMQSRWRGQSPAAPNPAPALGSKSGLERPDNPLPGSSPHWVCSNEPRAGHIPRCEVRAGAGSPARPSRSPQCSGPHSFRSLDAFSLGTAVNCGVDWGPADHSASADRKSCAPSPTQCRKPTSLALFRRLARGGGALWCLHQSGRGPRPPPITAWLLRAAVQEPLLDTARRSSGSCARGGSGGRLRFQRRRPGESSSLGGLSRVRGRLRVPTGGN